MDYIYYNLDFYLSVTVHNYVFGRLLSSLTPLFRTNTSSFNNSPFSRIVIMRFFSQSYLYEYVRAYAHRPAN